MIFRRWDDALLQRRFIGYALFRLRGVLLSTLIGTSAHVIELWLLFQWFAAGSLHRALTVKIALGAVAGAHFGALEILRRRLREKHSRRPLDVWWTGNVALGAVMLAGSLVWFALSAHTSVDVYVLIYFARAAIDLPLRTLHSGVYAFGRVRRPLVLVPLIELSGLLVVWLGGEPAVALVIALVVTSVLSRAATGYYAVAAYRSRERALPRLTRYGLRRYVLAVAPQVSLAAAAGFALRTAELSVILFLLRGTVPFEDPLQLTLFLFLFAPVLAVAAGSAQAFYPDLVMASAPRRRWIAIGFFRRLRVVAIVVGVGSFLLGFLPFFVLPFGDLVPIWIVLAPATIVLASWSYEQMIDFAAGRFVRLLARMAVVCGCALLALFVPRPLWLGPSAAALGAFVGLIAFAIVYRARHAVDPRSWSALVVKAPATIVVLHVPRLGGHAVPRLAARLSGVQVERGRIAVVVRGAVPADIEWAVRCGGWLERIDRAEVRARADVSAAVASLRGPVSAPRVAEIAAVDPAVHVIDLARGAAVVREWPEALRMTLWERVFGWRGVRIPSHYVRVIDIEDAPRFLVVAARAQAAADVGARVDNACRRGASESARTEV